MTRLESPGHAAGLDIVTVESWGLTRKGGARDRNQDAFLNWPERLVWCVADGVGGGSRGDAASRHLVRNLMQIPAPASLDAHIGNVRGLLDRSNHELRRGCQGEAASTVAVLLIHGGRAACLWSGDSRCYLLRGDVLYQCTRDHTLRQLKVERRELTIHEAARMVPGNVVTRAVGAEGILRLETSSFSLRRGDRFLLCSDGLSQCMPPQVLSAHLAGTRAREAALGLAEAARMHAHRDDVTIVTVFLSGR